MKPDDVTDILCSCCGDTYIREHATRIKHPSDEDHLGKCCACTDFGYGWRPNEWDPVEDPEMYAEYEALSPGQKAYLAREVELDKTRPPEVLLMDRVWPQEQETEHLRTCVGPIVKPYTFCTEGVTHNVCSICGELPAYYCPP